MRATEKELGEIHKGLYVALHTTLKQGIPTLNKKSNEVVLKKPTAALLTVARKFMVDNTVSAGKDKSSPKLSDFYQIPPNEASGIL